MQLNPDLKFRKHHDALDLYTTSEKFYLLPIEDQRNILIIDRLTGKKQIEEYGQQIPANAVKTRIYGILGTVTLIAGSYLIVATKRNRIGQFNNHDFYQLFAVEIIPYSRTSIHLSQVQMEMNKRYLNMLQSVFDTPYFYFSYTYDITHTMQRLHIVQDDFFNVPMHERADKRFLWNAGMLKKFCTNPEFSYFTVPLIHGFISMNWCKFDEPNPLKNTFCWIIISRRSFRRAGTRLFKRGIDTEGNVANFVETEQIVSYNEKCSSYVQIRGSIPVFWTQYPNLHLKSPIQISANENHVAACQKHTDDLINSYNEVVLVNLIDHRRQEGKLEKIFKEVVNYVGNKKIRYEAFDFHQECKQMRWDRLQILIDRLSYDQDNFKYFFVQEDKLLFIQNGVFRTNCVDCLDRTNVVQSLFAKRNLKDVLCKMGILTQEQDINAINGLDSLFRNVWADHANIISIQYSGSSALKTDFTRTGKRTFYGMLLDGWTSLDRYYLNNLKDGFRQDAIDFFLGNYQIQDGEGLTVSSPLDKALSWKSLAFTVTLLFAIAMFFANAIFSNEYSTATLLSLLFWAAMITITFFSIIRHGTEFVDYPKLIPFRNG